MQFSSDYINPYNTRLDRVRFAVKQLVPFGINDKEIINIGGGGNKHLQKSLKELNSNSSCYEVDIEGDNDLTLNLDTIDRLPFEDKSFDFCLLTDVLEHLENFHLILDECFRITKTAIIISLPIPSNAFLRILLNRQYTSDETEGGIYSKQYGLPTDPPQDRHRWWFTYDDVIYFFKNFEKQNNCNISIFSNLPKTNLIDKLIRLLIPKRIYSNFFYNSTWIIIEKTKVPTTSRFLKSKLDKENLMIKSIGDYSLHLDKNDPGISATLFKPKYFRKWHREPVFMDIMEAEVHRGDVVFEVGANIGYATMFLAKYVGDSGKVFAVEPVPINFEILTKNIKLNNLSDIIEAHNLAISSRTGVRKLNIAKESNLHSLTKTKNTIDAIEVETTTVDHFFEYRPFVNFIKMDIEGDEVEVLQGINKILDTSDKPMKILMEVHPMNFEAEAFAKELRRLFALGFTTKYLVSAGRARPPFFIERGYKPIKIYKTGDFTRGLYNNIDNEDVIEAASKLFDNQVYYLPITQILKNPRRIFNYKVVSTQKIVRSILIERG